MGRCRVGQPPANMLQTLVKAEAPSRRTSLFCRRYVGPLAVMARRWHCRCNFAFTCHVSQGCTWRTTSKTLASKACALDSYRADACAPGRSSTSERSCDHSSSSNAAQSFVCIGLQGVRDGTAIQRGIRQCSCFTPHACSAPGSVRKSFTTKPALQRRINWEASLFGMYSTPAACMAMLCSYAAATVAHAALIPPPFATGSSRMVFTGVMEPCSGRVRPTVAAHALHPSTLQEPGSNASRRQSLSKRYSAAWRLRSCHWRHACGWAFVGPRPLVSTARPLHG